MRVLLVGNPNSGKTTLFNALTGQNQRVGNWPGVTVEQKIGQVNPTTTLVDLPGLYSLTLDTEASTDAKITANALLQADADIFINVVDACHLERHLYLTSQLLELGKPVIIVLNMLDIAAERGISINQQALARILDCPVIALSPSERSTALDTLRRTLQTQLRPSTASSPCASYIKPYATYLATQGITPALLTYISCRLLEGDTHVLTLTASFAQLPDLGMVDSDIHCADARYQQIHKWVQESQTSHTAGREHITARLDRILLHRIWALPIFFSIMYAMFWLAMNIGGVFQDCFDQVGNALFVQGSTWVLQHLHAPNWFIGLMADGIGKGLTTTVTFIPVLAIMYFLLAFLESSGYMARAAFIVDRFMRYLGLPGKAFVPLLIGFGCNVPAILATRTLDSERDRIITSLMSPFMSCTARLAIYTVFVAAFFPHGGQNIVFSLYLLGIAMALLTGLILRKSYWHGKVTPLLLELPIYHRPLWSQLGRETKVRLRLFIVRAGRLIVPICMGLGLLNAIYLPTGLSVLSQLGQWLTPAFAPMGITNANWPATVGLITGSLAKEVVIGSLNSLYAQLTPSIPISLVTIGQTIWNGFSSIPHNLVNLFGQWNTSPSAGELTTYHLLSTHFGSQAAAYAYLIFILLYIPCISTMAVIRQETAARWMWFAIGWSLFVAYTTAVCFYQIATLSQHPQLSLGWIIIVLVMISGLFWHIRRRGQHYAHANL